MPRKKIYVQKVDEWLLRLEELKYSPRTFKSYKCYAMRAYKELENAGFDTDPRKLTKEAALFVINEVFHNHGRNIAGWNNYLKFCGNPVLEVMEYRTASPQVMRADWLDLDEMQDIQVWEACETTLERVVVHLELHLCLRNVEVMRQQMAWFGNNDILVLGKGKYPGKWGRIPYHPYTYDVLEEVREWRERSEKRLGEPLPGNITAYTSQRFHRAVVPGETSLRKVILGLRQRTGLNFSHHTLRRTGARRYWKAGAPLEKIQQLLRHESINQTRSYLGVNLEDTQEIMHLGLAYDKKRKTQKIPEIRVLAR